MVKVLKANPEHAEAIIEFQKAMAYETESFVLEDAVVKKGVAKIFRHSEMGCYYIAYFDDTVAGCCLTLYEWSDWRNAYVIWIHSVYVVPEYRKKGVFKEIYAHIKNTVENNEHFAGIRLYVEKNNTKAQAVYEKMGMNKNHYDMYEWLKVR